MQRSRLSSRQSVASSRSGISETMLVWSVQPLLSRSVKGWRLASDFGLKAAESSPNVALIEDDHCKADPPFVFERDAYQIKVLPFGLAMAPRTFTKCVNAVLSLLRLSGMHILNYLDDWLLNPSHSWG